MNIGVADQDPDCGLRIVIFARLDPDPDCDF